MNQPEVKTLSDKSVQQEFRIAEANCGIGDMHNADYAKSFNTPTPQRPNTSTLGRFEGENFAKTRTWLSTNQT
jgi:hypothetical protein